MAVAVPIGGCWNHAGKSHRTDKAHYRSDFRERSHNALLLGFVKK
jgi:hypothetical protein